MRLAWRGAALGAGIGIAAAIVASIVGVFPTPVAEVVTVIWPACVLGMGLAGLSGVQLVFWEGVLILLNAATYAVVGAFLDWSSRSTGWRRASIRGGVVLGVGAWAAYALTLR